LAERLERKVMPAFDLPTIAVQPSYCPKRTQVESKAIGRSFNLIAAITRPTTGRLPRATQRCSPRRGWRSSIPGSKG
jgi:hypothetical protein